jgi:hypothetical protein
MKKSNAWMGTSTSCRTAREPAVGEKQVSEADGKSSRSGELKGAK